ncbi:hypothetical protein I4U23_029233 [Adineta vaga]|nr:hypothetical protein I4U23_029233 [Adineta vaga]
MTNFADISSVDLIQHELNRYVFNKEISDNEIRQQLNEIIISLIKQHGFKDFNPECVFVLQSCLFDVYQDLLIRFKQHMESLGSSITIQDALERTLNEIMSSNLQDLYDYMKEQH